MKKAILILSSLAALACAEEVGQQPVDAGIMFGRLDTLSPDYRIIDSAPVVDQQVDALPAIDPCDNATVDDYELYCRCRPNCCEEQEWFCPPQPDNTIQSMQVIIEVCNDDGEACEFGQDLNCPPPQIINRSVCQVTHECPPGSSRDFLRWFECQLADGRTGRQRVLCDKGQIIHGPCTVCEDEVCDGIDNDCDDRVDENPVICEDECGPGIAICQDGEVMDCVNREPSEEICNFVDDDCDGDIDEGQRNDCNQCGELPPELCDGEDNDCDDSIDEHLIRECETPCERGVESCLQGRWSSCTATAPRDEECDGLDNDCDGLPDEGLNCVCTIDQVGALFPCSEEPLWCGQGFKSCMCQDVDCEVIFMSPCMALCAFLPAQGVPCEQGVGRPIEDEICNNFDEDCDDLIDENLSQACYTGPRDTLNVGICLPGTQSCIDGTWGGPDAAGVWQPDMCVGEVVPIEEVCNGSDDDCDGQVDYGEELRDTDILLIIDTSGSMTGEIRAVTQALSRFGQHFAAEDAIHWGLIIGPTRIMDPEAPRSNLELLTMVSNIVPFPQFFADFMALDPDEFDGGLEMHIDAVMLALRNLAPLHVNLVNREWVRGVISIPEKDAFVMNWRPNTDRIIIVFTDEDEQSYMQPEFHRDDLARALQAAPNTKMYTFALGFYGWDELAVASGGQNFDLTPSAEEMYNNLMSIIDEICLPRANGAARRGAQGASLLPMTRPQYRFASSSYEWDQEEKMCY